ncbi:Mannose or cellobiose epimerase, N-acyl-D-glucosamine 2-epimerase family [Fulvimarina manganoxydans]|uniref:Mannose or cellobiose epimerase, N-acyl-D-glucosamine 2-epimerase family n=1 Tax=Fulvimarina manganoxydans TaxID=937218 RepID=A0A1W1YZ85_9HYPH|nr:AGE family epimerase/isomerase [Fulvimarina manganoxydans]SMC40998.1 Mannose or cellobiose epimerase, N-acyl-D-glucosamine 2-epimerase family [Fulvimarina manganoxydans]
MTPPLASTETGFWLDDPTHRAFLAADARRQLAFFDRSLRQDGGLVSLDYEGKPLKGPQELFATTRLVHSYGLAQIAGRPDAAGIVDRGMDDLWTRHRDKEHGGYLHAVDGEEVVDGIKLGYGHVFVLLAASTAKQLGHPDADRLFDDIVAVLDRHYWDEAVGLFRDEFTRDWQPFSTYRGMNANMHGVEALLAAFEATGEPIFLTRARRILAFFIDRIAPQEGWRIAEHYTDDWRIDRAYEGNPMFRPAGTTPGHSFEMARLHLQAWDLAGRPDDDSVAKARRLAETALLAWDERRGGFAYTLNVDGTIARNARYWWPVTEAIGVVAALIKLDRKESDEVWYRKLWRFADQCLIDHETGGWFPELGENDRPAMDQFAGKPDIYHALQAELFPLAGGISRAAEALAVQKPLAE